MRNVNDYLAELAANPEKLIAFIYDPERSMREGGLSLEDQAVVKSNFAYMMHSRMSGYTVARSLVIPPPPPPPVWKPGPPHPPPWVESPDSPIAGPAA